MAKILNALLYIFIDLKIADSTIDDVERSKLVTKLLFLKKERQKSEFRKGFLLDEYTKATSCTPAVKTVFPVKDQKVTQTCVTSTEFYKSLAENVIGNNLLHGVKIFYIRNSLPFFFYPSCSNFLPLILFRCHILLSFFISFLLCLVTCYKSNRQMQPNASEMRVLFRLYVSLCAVEYSNFRSFFVFIELLVLTLLNSIELFQRI